MEKKEKKSVLVLDIGADYQDGVTAMVTKLRDLGVMIRRPEHVVEFIKNLALASPRCSSNGYPSLIVNLHFGGHNVIREAMKAAELLKINMVNKYFSAAVTGHRVSIKSLLEINGIKTPRYALCHPKAIPEELGDWVVYKELKGHFVCVMDRRKVHNLEEIIYVEEQIENPTKLIRSVYSICGEVFTVTKVDDFATNGSKAKHKQLVQNCDYEIATTAKIAEITGLEIFNVDFVSDYVVDVNAFPNFFFHQPAVDSLIKYICRQIGMPETVLELVMA